MQLRSAQPHTYRNPWYNETDLSIEEVYQIGESKAINFQATITNALNDHAVTAVYSQADSSYVGNQFITPGGQAIYDGIPFYAAAMTPYNVQGSFNGNPSEGSFPTARPVRKPSTASMASRSTGSILGRFVCRQRSRSK